MTLEIQTENQTLSQSLKTQAMAQHQQAEHSSFMSRLVKGQVSKTEYVAYLMCLREIYQTLEALWVKIDAPWKDLFQLETYFRSEAIEADLNYWITLVEPVKVNDETQAALRRYVTHLHQVAKTEPILLVAHAYTRYLGDLSGGQMIRQILLRHGFPEDGLNFYVFNRIPAPAMAKNAFKQALDQLGQLVPDLREALVAETQKAFELNAQLFTILGISEGGQV